MQRFILGRLLQSLITMWAVVTVVFFLGRLSGDPTNLLIDESSTLEHREALRAKFGLDQPLYAQYGKYLLQVIRGDFGESLKTHSPVFELILERAPATLELALVGILITVAIALPIGVYAAVRQGSPLDQGGRFLAVLGQSIPPWWLGIVMIQVFAVGLGLLPSGGRGGLRYLILPSITIGWFASAGIMRLTRSSMLEVLDSEYVKLARVKGLSEPMVIWKHAFKNAALPVVTFGSLVFVASFLTGSITTEVVFAWPGVGRLALDAVMTRDFPVLQAVVFFFSFLYITANLIVDILYAYLNPKIRYQT